MARYAIFDGGNKRRYPWDSDRDSGIDPSYAVRYSAHLTNFHKVLRYHLDFNSEVMREWQVSSTPTGALVANDDLVLFSFGPGTKLSDFVLQTKGIPPTVGEGGNPPPTPPSVTFTVENEDGTVAHTIGSYTLDATGYTYVNLSAEDTTFLPNNGYLVMRLTAGTLAYSCFGAMVGLVQYFDPHGCECVTGCGADFPDPDCTTGGFTNENGGLGFADEGC